MKRTEQLVRRANVLRKRGWTYVQIGADIGVSWNTIRRWLNADADEYSRRRALQHYHRYKAKHLFTRREQAARNKSLYKKYARKFSIKKRFGLSVEQYDLLLAQPCAICGRPSECLDHCHKTNCIRQALCMRCNTMLGMSGDQPTILRKAARYISYHTRKTR